MNLNVWQEKGLVLPESCCMCGKSPEYTLNDHIFCKSHFKDYLSETFRLYSDELAESFIDDWDGGWQEFFEEITRGGT